MFTAAHFSRHMHTNTLGDMYTRGTDTALPHSAFFPKYFTSQLLFHVLSECVSACLGDTQAKRRTKGLGRRRKERKERKRRKCFVCFVRMNASMHRHACLHCVNTHALVESEPGAKQIDWDDKQIDRIIYFPITPRPASVLQSLSLSCKRCQWWKIRQLLEQ